MNAKAPFKATPPSPFIELITSLILFGAPETIKKLINSNDTVFIISKLSN